MVAPSYKGPTVDGRCPHCGNVTEIADPEVMGNGEGRCNNCEEPRQVEWEVA